MISIVDVGVASVASPRGWAPSTDDRSLVSCENALFAVTDASGPTYGGYHAPIAIDLALAELERTFAVADGSGSIEGRLREAIVTAHRLLFRHGTTYMADFERLVRTNDDRLGCALQASKRIAAEQFGLAIDCFAHFAAALSAMAFDATANRAAIAQLGNSRVYRERQRSLDILIREHTVAAQNPELECELDLNDVCTTTLGMTEDCRVELLTIDVEPGDRFLLCTDGVWRQLSAAKIGGCMAEPLTAEEIARELARSAAGSDGDDATAIVIFVA